MHGPNSVVVRVNNGALLGVDIPGYREPATLVVTVRSAPISPFVPDEFKEGGRCWIPIGG